MIEKIIRIKNVGKFLNFSSAGDISFRRITIIFSENGLGKTTLCAILRSLQSGNKIFIKERRTLGQQNSPYVELLMNGAIYKFDNDIWNNSSPLIEIFDPYFIRENIYSGDSVYHQHKRNLHSFAIGEQGVKLSERADKLDDQIRKINPIIAQKQSEIQRHIIGSMPLVRFLDLEQIPDVDEKIRKQIIRIEAIKRSNEIKNQDLFSSLKLEQLPFESFQILLSKRIEYISEEIEEKIKAHISHCMDEKGESWISQGLGYVKEDSCPFCGLNMSGLELIAAYKDYFSEAYNSFKEEINRMSLLIDSIFSNIILLSLQRNIQSNKTLCEFWKQYVNVNIPEIHFDLFKNVYENIYSKLSELIKQKTAAPLDKVQVDNCTLKALIGYHLVRVAILRYNKIIEESNQKIEQKKDSIGKADIRHAENELDFLNISKNRFQEKIDSLCSEYRKLVKEKTDLEKLKIEAKQKLNSFSKQLLKDYQEQINSYLSNFATDFQIVEAEEDYIGGKPRISYRLAINNEPFDLDSKFEGSPCLKNTLSSGDKTSLAFAFFMARLEKDLKLKDKIIVLDDPLSSLDYNRRNCTQAQIVSTSSKAKQVIILSHDPYFLRLLWEKLDPSITKTLCIKRMGNGSKIDEWDIEKETRGEYFNNYFALNEYLESGPDGDLRKVARCIRPLLEGNLRMRFPGRFSRTEWLGDMISHIQGCDEQDSLFCIKQLHPDLKEINDYSKKYHHSPQNPLADQYPVVDAELKQYVD